MNKQAGNLVIIIVILTVVIIAGGVLLYRIGTFPIPIHPQQQSSVIQDDNTLMNASNQLDNTNVDSVNSQLNQTQQDATSL